MITVILSDKYLGMSDPPEEVQATGTMNTAEEGKSQDQQQAAGGHGIVRRAPVSLMIPPANEQSIQAADSIAQDMEQERASQVLSSRRTSYSIGYNKYPQRGGPHSLASSQHAQTGSHGLSGQAPK